MRLDRVRRGQGLPQKLIMLLIRLTSGFRAPDVVRTLMYRPGFFGGHMRPWTHAVMRGPSEWSVAERELFATFTSSLYRCPF